MCEKVEKIMSYDRIWIESTEHPRGLLECREAEKKNLSDDFVANFNRLYAQGDFVVLSAAVRRSTYPISRRLGL
jgi:hypothetical protein